MRFSLLLILFSGFLFAFASGPTPAPKPQDALSPREELATFKIHPDLKVELVASEPDVIDPVAMAFDEDGRIFVAEMRGYPNKGVGTGNVTSRRINSLEARNGDVVDESTTTFAEGLRVPKSVMPDRGGLLVANAPDLIYLKDTDGDGKADVNRRLYTGFHLGNVQQMLNSIQWGMDNYVYAIAGNNGGVIQSVEKPKTKAVTLRGRGVRFRPDLPASLEATSGGGQYGLAPDEWQRWFTATNSQHLRQIVLPDHYLRRNPSLAVRNVTINIPDHGASCKLFRISPFEGWRVERTRRRRTGPKAKRFSPTELVPGGFSTSSCSPIVYLANLLPKSFHGQIFLCDPANNLIHRDRLTPKGAIFQASRVDKDCELLASTNNWFRPVFLTIGPDGAIYVLDFYREVIEHPLSLPDDIKARLNLQSRKRGRIWRIIPNKKKVPPIKIALSRAKSLDLVENLNHANLWWRLTSQRLLVERQDKTVVKALEKLSKNATTAPGRAHALWALQGLKSLSSRLIEQALKDEHPGVRAQALRLSESHLESAPIRDGVLRLVNDPSAQVRFQLAFTLGEMQSPKAASALAKILQDEKNDTWTQTAALSSSYRHALDLLKTLASKKTSSRLLSQIASMIGAQRDEEAMSATLRLIAGANVSTSLPILEGLGRGMEQSGRSMSSVLKKPSPRLLALFQQAAKSSSDSELSVARRVAATRLLGYGPFEIAEQPLKECLQPQQRQELQLAAIRALSSHQEKSVGDVLLERWKSSTPIVRREIIEAMLARRERVSQLLDAIEKKQLFANQLESSRIQQLRRYPNAKLRRRAIKLLADLATPDRKKILASYQSVLKLKGDVMRGKAAFTKVCATCHRLGEVGVEVGADLKAALPNKTASQLLIDILDPSREVDSRYINYVVDTKKGRSLTGLIATETATSVTLRRAQKEESTILRDQIDEIRSSGKSLMPEGLEKQLTKQMLADLIAFLKSNR